MVEPLISRTRPAASRLPQASAPKAAPSADASQAAPQGDRLQLAERAAPRTRPMPILPEGRLDYYQRRHQDFVARHPEATPPTYYLGYGDLYVRRFTTELAPELSEKGQAWLVQARKNLQVAIEVELARNPEIELNDQAFTEFAYATHSRAYLDAGLTSLPVDDLIRVAVTPNLRDTLNRKGLAVIAETAEEVARDKLAALLHAPADTAQELLNALKTSPDLVRDVSKLLDTPDNSHLLLEGMVKLKSWPRNVSTNLMDRLVNQTSERLERTIEAFRQARALLPAGS